MLNGITWGQFTIFILAVTAGYYLYVGVRFYGPDFIGKLGRGKPEPGGVNGKDGWMQAGKTGIDHRTGIEADQAELFEQSDKVAKGNEMFKAMQHAIGVLRQLIAWGVENKLDRENFLDHLHEVLSKYRQLKGTDYAGTINNYLIRVCSSEFSLQLGEAELAELWK